MSKIEKQPETRVNVVELNELYPDIERMPVSSKLRTYLKQVSLKIDREEMLDNNPYLARLVAECSLFLPEMFLDRWVKHWEYQSAIALEGNWLSSTLDFAINRENELLIIDWSGVEGDAIAIAQAYLLSQRLGFEPRNVSVISLIANPLNEDKRINQRSQQAPSPVGGVICDFIRRLFRDNDFCICQQELEERLALLACGEDLNPVPEPEAKEPNLLLDIESIPEVVID